MKKYIIFYIFLQAILLLSCEGLTTSSSDPWKKISGTWSVNMYGKSQTVSVSATSSNLTFDGVAFSGSWSGNSFSGDNRQSNNGATYDSHISISLNGDNKFSGTYTVKVTFMGKSNSASEYFTGTK